MKTYLIKKLTPAAIALAIGGAPQAMAQANEDEWYDPTDWFDGNNIESDDTYSYDPYDFDYDYDYGAADTYDYGDNWNTYDVWGYDMWEPGYYSASYWNGFDWDDDLDAVDPDYAQTFTYVAFADPVSTTGDNRQGSTSSANRGSKESQNVARLNGEIEGFSKMQLKRDSGATGTYTVAKVKLDNGKSTIVNLGRDSQLSDLDLQKGDKVQALGRRGTIDNATVFVAHKLTVDGETIDANPAIRLAMSGTSKGGQNSSSTAGSMRTLEGTVASVDETHPQGGQADHTFINLELENGQSALVDLGPAASLDRIGLEEGDDVTVRGTTKQVEGRQVLIPRLMKVEGERVASVSK